MQLTFTSVMFCLDLNIVHIVARQEMHCSNNVNDKKTTFSERDREREKLQKENYFYFIQFFAISQF